MVFDSIENNDLFDTAVDLLVEICTHPSTHKWVFLTFILEFSAPQELETQGCSAGLPEAMLSPFNVMTLFHTKT